MSNKTNLRPHANPSRIIGIQFSMLSPEEIRKNSVAEITKRDTYINNKPVIGGMFDPRMGVLEPGLICPTDGLTYIDTPGYFGHIELGRPVFFIQHIKDIMKVCRCVCFKCSKLKINKQQHKHALEMSNMDRWDYVSKIAVDVKRCGDSTDDGCGCLQPDKIKLEGMATIIAVWSNVKTDTRAKGEKVTMKMTPEIILKIFKRISDEDVSFMGFNPLWSRPDWMICQVLPVAPPAVRPSVKHDAQQRSEDDLTHIYSNIIKTNTDLVNKINDNAQPNVIEGLTTVLQYFVAMIVNNKVKGAMPMAQRSGRPLQCIMGRINSKNGRIRGNLMGKRVDFSARSVITGDPNLSIRQLGVPMKIAKNITKPIKVNDRNCNFLMKLIQNGPDKYPGAKILERKNGEQISLRYVDRDSIRLENGDIVHRHMMNGDAVLFNRQPSLHRMSMMCHIVQVMKVGDTFRMNVGDTKPYNADFDGDEMNMHMPQNVIAETELRHLAAIPYQIISPANNSPIIGIYQDSMLGSYRFTRKRLEFTPREAMNLLMMHKHVDVDSLLASGDKISNFDILSQIMPPITMQYTTDAFGDGDDYATSNNVLEIRSGKYLRGQMDKAVLGKSTKGIIHRAFNDFGNRESSDFIDNLQNIITEYMKSSSFSVGISDLIADANTNTQIVQVINKQKGEVQTIIDKLHMGIFENNTSSSNQAEFEKRVNNVLNDAMNETGKISRKSLNKDNRFAIIVSSGSKGSLLNISQMISCLGQQNVDGKRIPYGFDSRTLPHFSKFDDSPNARGFVENSYISGLSAPELFFHAMGGRIGLIDTAVKSVTWETPIVVIVAGKPMYTEIGKWIDGQLDSEEIKPNVLHFDERNMELLNLTNGDVFIPTTCENGIVSWEEVTAITRHDPGDVLYEIKSLGGRSVIVTESKSLLIWDDAKNGFFEKSTPDIKVGDCLPVTSSLQEPPVVLDFVLLSEYLPKTEYLYGTDFNVASCMMNESMDSRKKIPSGWWDLHNGKEFQLPYNSKASLQRTVSRSNITAIKDGGVYPYHARRADSFVCEKFELNEENGIFIGLFLADGNVHGEHIHITKNNKEVQEFVKSWYDNKSIQYSMHEKVNHSGGISTTIAANCSVLATFLRKFVGHGAAHKHIPTESYIANLSFVKGLLSGYFSGDGTVSKNSIEACSASSRLIDGINMLCSRIGVFGKVSKTQLKRNNFGTKRILPSYRLSIRSQWGKVFSENIRLIEPNKQARLMNIQWRNYHSNFKTHNDVVLDPIVEITLVSVEKHPKVYDLTIPTTLNFGLANGLQVRDTSQTGYIQRRLIKGLEDLKVEYDMTVRNSKGKIVQFSYGDDGFDTTRVENQVIPLVGMSIEDIYMHYDILGVADVTTNGLLSGLYTKGAITRLRKQKLQAEAKSKKYIDKMIHHRNDIVEYMYNNRDENCVRIPVAFHSIIQNTQGNAGLNANSMVDITPLETYQLIEEYYSKIEQLFYAPPTALFNVMYFYYLSPRDLLMNKRFHKAALIVLLETIVLKYKQAIVHPGEMVGVIAGQSIGEPTTQLTLNSVTYETEILVRNSKGEIQCVQIGDFTKDGIATSPKIEYMQDKDTTYAELAEYYEVPSATESGETVWRRIEAVTKHPVINEDGTNTMIKVTTKGNREVIATKAKSFLQLVDGKIQGVHGKDLKVGEYLPVSKKALDFTETHFLDLREMLPTTEYIYGTEIEKARGVVDEYQWWSKHANKTFVLPYSRSDSLYCVLKGTKRSENQVVYKPGCIYTTTNSICNYTIPEVIPLDYEFGYLVGAYCAEGCMTKHQISIANNDAEYLKPIEQWCARYNITTKIYTHKNKIQEGWTSQDIRLYNTVLCRILDKMAGKLSHNKFVSPKIMFSNRECIRGFLEAYIGGDGCVQINKQGLGDSIVVSSVSHKMLTQVQVMLKNVGVLSKMYKPTLQTSNNRGSQNIKQIYSLRISNNQAKNLATILTLPIAEKRERCKSLLSRDFTYDYCKADLEIPNLIDGITIMEPRDGRCIDLEFDQIVSIEEVPNTTDYAYDLTVEDTRTFDCMNGLTAMDTFHNAGTSSKSNVTRGVPRIEEILRLTKNPKNPSLTVFLKGLDEGNQERANTLANMLEHTRLLDVVSSVEICFDPVDSQTHIREDDVLMLQFLEFEKLVKECNSEQDEEETEMATRDNTNRSKWIIRMEFDPEILLDKNITMDDVNFAIKNSHYGNDIQCVYSDFNSDKLVFRIRLNASVFKKGKQKGVPESLDQSDEIYLLRNFQDNLLNNIVLRGINGIKNVLPRKIQNMVTKDDGKFVRKDTWVLDTTGSNFLDTLGIDYIDYKRTSSNDIKEVFDVLGIEAARNVLHNELVEVMEFSGVYINYHHTSLLCDRMTSNRNMVSIFRTGIIEDNIGPVAKATFEVHTEVLLDAARHADFDHMRGVSANVMCGQNGFYGTNAFQLVLDMKEMEQLEDTLAEVKNVDQLINDMFEGVNKDTDICPRNKIEIDNNISTIRREKTARCDDDYNMGF